MVLAFFDHILASIWPLKAHYGTSNCDTTLKLVLNKYFWCSKLINRPKYDKNWSLKPSISYLVILLISEDGFRALAPKGRCWRMVFLINSECPNIIWVGKIDKHHGIFCLGCLTLNKPWGGGIKTQPIWRLPLARWTKFELNPPWVFLFSCLEHLNIFSFGGCI